MADGFKAKHSTKGIFSKKVCPSATRRLWLNLEGSRYFCAWPEVASPV
jgi:hypothetical protein